MKTSMVAAIFVAPYVLGHPLAYGHVPEECVDQVGDVAATTDLEGAESVAAFIETRGDEIIDKVHRFNATAVPSADGPGVIVDREATRDMLEAFATTLEVGSDHMSHLMRLAISLRDLVKCADAAHVGE